jgi:hypothetical protein
MNAGEERLPETPETKEPKLLERARARMRARHLSLRTEKSYLGWMRHYILFHGKRHPAEMGEAEINAFLTHLAVEKRVTVREVKGGKDRMTIVFRLPGCGCRLSSPASA